jgi:hypothetical protein
MGLPSGEVLRAAGLGSVPDSVLARKFGVTVSEPSPAARSTSPEGSPMRRILRRRVYQRLRPVSMPHAPCCGSTAAPESARRADAPGRAHILLHGSKRTGQPRRIEFSMG